MKLLHWVHDRAFALLLLVAILATGGVLVVLGMPLAIFPSVTFPVIKVIADVGDEPAARMMPSVTRPLEQALLAVPGIRVVRSTTSRGSTEISANFEWGTDMQVALQRLQEAIGRVRPDLPADAHIDHPALFDHLVGAGEQRRRHGEAERLRGLEVDDELELCGLQHGKVSGLLALENPADISSGLPKRINNAGAVTHEAAGFGIFARRYRSPGSHGVPPAGRKLQPAAGQKNGSAADEQRIGPLRSRTLRRRHRLSRLSLALNDLDLSVPWRRAAASTSRHT